MNNFAKMLSCGALMLASGLSVSAAIDNKAYGILAFSEDQYKMANHVVTFDLLSEAEPVFKTAVPFSQTSTAGAYGGKFYYIATSKEENGKEVPVSLVRVDLTTGSNSTVGSLNGFSNLINDMTYDWSTSRMYAVSRLDDTASGLYTIDLSTAAATKVATLDRRFFTLAASYSGQLYGISFAGDFCAIDKETGAVTVIGSTGQLPQKFQTMEFDHADRKLYWLASTHIFNESGTIEVPESFVATVNPATGEITRLRNFGDNQVAGLYIPSFAAPDNCPAAVLVPEVTPAAGGVSAATLSWTNPSSTFGGEPLKALTKVEISRGGAVVGTVTGAEPGKASTYTDNIGDAEGGVYEWLITPYNANGAGASVALSTFVGKDLPAAVTGITVTKTSPNSAILKWNPVTKGANGGWTDTETMTYDVVRNPGGIKVAEGLTVTEWTETGVEVSNTYDYTVTAVNSCGTSAPAVSPSIALGPKLGVPYACDFTDDFGQWTPVDANEDGNTWYRSAISWAKADGAYFMAANQPGDDWLVSNPMEFEPNSAYKVRLQCFANGNHPLDFYLLKDSDIANPLQSAGTVTLTRGYQLGWVEFQFNTGAEIGDCNLAMHNTAEKGNSYMIINRMEIEKLAAHNLAATALNGNVKPIEGNTYTYTVTVANKGSQTYETYSVDLVDQDGKVLATATATEPLAGGESAEVGIEYTFPVHVAVSTLCGKVRGEGDEISADDSTEPMAIELLPVGSPEEINIGKKYSTNYYHPLNLYSKFGASLNIYAASEVGVKRGRVTGVKYNVSVPSYSSGAKNVGLKIYLANTDRTKASDGWIPEEEMALVYDSTIDLLPGDLWYDITFTRAFDYEGGNLAMLVVTSLENSGTTYMYASQPYYNTNPLPGNSAVTYGGSAPFDFTGTPTTRSGNSVITLMVQSGGASVTGTVLDGDSKPLAGAEVTIAEMNAVAETAEDGTYRFDFVPNDTYTVTATKFGYKASEPVSVKIDDADGTADFTLVKLPVYTVTGRVLDTTGAPIADAAVALDGYTALSAVTSEDGSFWFSDVIASEQNTVTVSKPWYVDGSAEFNLNAPKNLGDITLGYAHFAPVNVSGEATDEAVTLAWSNPATAAEFRYDSGILSTQIGFSNAIGTAVIGSVFRTPMTLREVSWYTTSEGGPHNTVHLYIYDLDEQGNPTGTLLYSERAIFNKDDQWTVYTLPAAVDAPRGCFVSLNYPGFHAIGLDDGATNPSYPVEGGRYAFSVDYNSGDFMYFDLADLAGNLMIRAAGDAWSAEGMVPAQAEAPSFWKYNVWRAAAETEGAEWTAVNSAPLAETAFTDSSWATLAPGRYTYAVSTLFPDGTESAKTEAGMMLRDMFGSVTAHVSTNARSGKAAGAVATLTSDNNEVSREATVAEDGTVTFADGLLRATYTLALALPGYTFEPVEVNLMQTKDLVLDNLVMQEIIADPVNVELTGSFEDGFRLTWNESGDFTDDFEGHEAFAKESAGEVGWQYRDGDGARTFAEADFDFPGRTQPGSFMVFNPWLTTPSMADFRQASLPPNGQSELASFA
ncbi:MAG: carboxypeptidase regulatory-like domain-containing protein, partial [Duncaniella sp.]|nr:carboxypeptidase regulatory-like domain-containing protein [Duncaniella sp.]